MATQAVGISRAIWDGAFGRASRQSPQDAAALGKRALGRNGPYA